MFLMFYIICLLRSVNRTCCSRRIRWHVSTKIIKPSSGIITWMQKGVYLTTLSGMRPQPLQTKIQVRACIQCKTHWMPDMCNLKFINFTNIKCNNMTWTDNFCKRRVGILYLTAYVILFYTLFLTFYTLQLIHFRHSLTSTLYAGLHFSL
jgi:hypothetical protein